jgi:hypothetical protein
VPQGVSEVTLLHNILFTHLQKSQFYSKLNRIPITTDNQWYSEPGILSSKETLSEILFSPQALTTQLTSKLLGTTSVTNWTKNEEILNDNFHWIQVECNRRETLHYCQQWTSH